MARENYTTVSTDVKTWPQLLPFRQLMSSGRPSHHLVAAIFVSVAIHASILLIMATVRTAVEPTAPSIGTPIIVSLVSSSTLAADSHDVLDQESDLVVQRTNPPDQRIQASPEQNVKTEMVVATEDQEVPGSEAPEDKSLANEETPSIDLEDTYRITQEVEKMPEFVAGTVAASKVQGIPGLEAPAGKSLATDGISSFDLEASYKIARDVGREWESSSELITQSPRFTSRKLFLKNHLEIIRGPRPDCWTAQQERIFRGFLSIPFLLKDTITDTGCTWERKEGQERQWDRERQGDPGRLGFYIDEIINLGREK